uniref:PD-(D/E)XK endonuclease-like domain-containing protein n=1 Tax=Dictyoglomus thermophilum TaxID=14 RepID=A0A7V3ZID3_DICTH
MLKSVLDFEVDSVGIIYISKDDLDMKEYEIDVRSWRDLVYRDWQELYEFEEGVTKEFPRFPWECVNCTYRNLCVEFNQKWLYNDSKK